ncbi:MAG: alkaline phosphatase family protein [Bacteroidetes bacterium]|nr:alkaline phosphatase family protein [Bacteroidota bacterium]
MKKLSLFVLLALCFNFINAQSTTDTTQKIIAGRENSIKQEQKPYVILISADGFRYDYAEKYGATNLLNLANSGVRAESMIPSYPSLTFPNHYTLVTGLYPAHHGLVNNSFYDREKKTFYGMRKASVVKDGSWYGGTPIWVLAEQHKMLSASFYWVGSEADVKGVLPTYYYTYNEAIPIDRRIQIVKDWLQLPEDRRPHLITFYFPEVDHNGHEFGPDAPETQQSVRWLDSSIQKLVNTVNSTGLPVNFIFVSDHGMTTVDVDHPVIVPNNIDTTKFLVSFGAEITSLYAKNKADIPNAYQALKLQENGFKVYLRDSIPDSLHYKTSDDVMNRIGDILLVADWPRGFGTPGRKMKSGAHGYNPYTVKDMHATFYAWGPAFKKHITIPSFQNVNVYPIVADILKLKYDFKIDGTQEVAKEILKKMKKKKFKKKRNKLKIE